MFVHKAYLYCLLKEVSRSNRPVGLREQKDGNGRKLEVETPMFGECTPPAEEDVKTVMRIPTCLIVVNWSCARIPDIQTVKDAAIVVRLTYMLM